MTETAAKKNSDVQILSSILLSTLDEGVFFSELSKYIGKFVKSDNNIIYQVLDDSSVMPLVKNGRKLKSGKIIDKGVGPVGYVIRTKAPYFSNSVESDPIFEDAAKEGIKAELAIPVTIDGVVIASIHFQNKDEEKKFSVEDITKVIEILSDLKKPLTNMKMYLSAKYLNDALLRKIEQKEKELEERKSGLKVADSFKVEDRPFIGNSKETTHLLDVADKVSASDINFLIMGEKGTGKEHIAKRIHARSSRVGKGFASVDCSSSSEEQIIKEVFGEEIIDFSNGNKINPGLLEIINGGTLLINNIDSLSAKVQSKLFHYLNELMAFRMNGQVPFRSNVRIIATSSKDLREIIENGEFREDLFYALNTVSIQVPSLRERIEDIESLACHFLNLDKDQSEHKSLSPCVIKALKEYNWPGNVRELQNVIERAYILADGVIVERDHLADSVSKSEKIEEESAEEKIDFTGMTLDELEKRHICNTLDHLSGNKTKTAKMLGITVKTLYNKLHSYGMINSKEA